MSLYIGLQFLDNGEVLEGPEVTAPPVDCANGYEYRNGRCRGMTHSNQFEIMFVPLYTFLSKTGKGNVVVISVTIVNISWA